MMKDKNDNCVNTNSILKLGALIETGHRIQTKKCWGGLYILQYPEGRGYTTRLINTTISATYLSISLATPRLFGMAGFVAFGFGKPI